MEKCVEVTSLFQAFFGDARLVIPQIPESFKRPVGRGTGSQKPVARLRMAFHVEFLSIRSLGCSCRRGHTKIETPASRCPRRPSEQPSQQRGPPIPMHRHLFFVVADSVPARRLSPQARNRT